MTEINRSGQDNSLGDIDITQGKVREQLDALTDAVRQLGGNANIQRGAVVNDPLSSPYTLYCNSYTGSDKFVAGSYSTADDGSFAQKMRRIELQRLECGYTSARPFKTINRCLIEAAIITSKSFLTRGKICGDNVTIIVESGLHEVINGPGKELKQSNFPSWTDGKEPTVDELRAFNPTNGGVIVPRSSSVVSMDLRKARLSPCYVPTSADEAADRSNRSAILRVTGGCYIYGFTFSDRINSTDSHHLLSCFEFASTEQLNEFYQKIRWAFGANAGISNDFAVRRSNEDVIVGPVPDTGQQGKSTDTTQSASPYIYNISVRSQLGLCGIYADGAKVDGFKSYVIAQFTGVSLQRDMRCWQRYHGGKWQAIGTSGPDHNYDLYVKTQPDDVRMDPKRATFHIAAVNKAIIQEVSVFAIGQAIHHRVESGGELTVTNSNSNFGGCASLATGTHDETYATDTNWNVSRIKVARDIETALANKFQTYNLGELADSNGNGATTIKLKQSLGGTDTNEPINLARDGYSLDNYGTRSLIWLENPTGPNFYAELADTAWNPSKADEIKIKGAFKATDGSSPGSSNIFPDIKGLRIFVRRLRDIRTLDERTYSLICENSDSEARNIVRDYAIQTDTTDQALDKAINATEQVVVQQVKTLPNEGTGVLRTNEIELRRASASAKWDDRGAYKSAYHETNNYYRLGDVVRYANKHWKCIKEHVAGNFESKNWDQTYVHMAEDFAAEDFFKNSKTLLIFDRDFDTTGKDVLLGYRNSSLWDDVQVARQLRTNTDYLGVYSFLRSLGFGGAQATKILRPKDVADRLRDPNRSLDAIGNPDGAANTWDNWAIGFRRPSNIRLFNHSFEWAGLLNYSKSLPKYQKDLTASNKFTYFATNAGGGRVYLSGFNEEGFQVTAAGLTDLQTGEQISPEGLGGGGIDSGEKVFAGNVTINGDLKVNGSLDIDQQAQVAALLDDINVEPSKGMGLSYIAPAESMTGFSSNGVPTEAAKTFNQQNNDGTKTSPHTGENRKYYSGPNFVTPFYLDTWKGQNGLVGKTAGAVNVFINPRADAPDNPELPDSSKNESLNWNSEANDLIGQPPTTPETACKSLTLAVQYANLAVATTTRVNYYLGCGIYKDDCKLFDFTHPVYLLGYDFVTNKVTCDGRGGGQFPLLRNNGSIDNGITTDGINEDANLNLAGDGQNVGTGGSVERAFKDAKRAPCFLTRVYASAVNAGSQCRVGFQPTRFRFRNPSYVRGLHIWGATTTAEMLAGDDNETFDNVPNDFYGSSLTQGDCNVIKTQARRAGVLNALIGQLAKSVSTNIYYISDDSVFEFSNRLYVYETAISAVGLPYKNAGRSDDQAVFTSMDNGSLFVSGMYLIGNNQFDNSVYTNNNGQKLTFRGQDNFEFSGFSNVLFSVDSGSPNHMCTFEFGSIGGVKVDGPSNHNRNLCSNNIHLLNSAYRYMKEEHCGYYEQGTIPSELSNNWKHGPSFAALIGARCKNRRIGRNNFTDFRVSQNNKRSGVVGNFGMYRRRIGGSLTQLQVMGLSNLDEAAADDQKGTAKGSPYNSLIPGTTWEYQSRSFMFRRHSKGTNVTPGDTILQPSSGQIRHPIFANTWSWGLNPLYYLNIKYVSIKPGIDFGFAGSGSSNVGGYSCNSRILG